MMTNQKLLVFLVLVLSTVNFNIQHSTSQHSQQTRPTPESWGWKWDECEKEWTPVWPTQPIASTACIELVKCGYKSEKGRGTRCTCKKANWSCTYLCKCNCLIENSN